MPKSQDSAPFQIKLNNIPNGPFWVGIDGDGWCTITDDPDAAGTFTLSVDGENRKFITASNGWLSYSTNLAQYARVGIWSTLANYQTWIQDGVLKFEGDVEDGFLSFFSDGGDGKLYDQAQGKTGYHVCEVEEVPA